MLLPIAFHFEGDITHVLLLVCLHFPMVATGINREGMSLLMWLVAF